VFLWWQPPDNAGRNANHAREPSRTGYPNRFRTVFSHTRVGAIKRRAA